MRAATRTTSLYPTVNRQTRHRLIDRQTESGGFAAKHERTRVDAKSNAAPIA